MVARQRNAMVALALAAAGCALAAVRPSDEDGSAIGPAVPPPSRVERREAEVAPASPVPSVPAATRAAGLPRRFEPGERAVYAVDHATEGAIEFVPMGAPAGGEPDPDAARQRTRQAARLSADVEVAVHEAGPGGAVLGFRVAAGTYELAVDGQISAGDAGALGEETLARLDPAGRIVAFHFPEGMPAGRAAYVAAILAEFQVVLAPADRATWEELEEGPGGAGRWVYRRTGPRGLEKGLAALVRPAVHGAGATRPERAHGRRSIELDERGRLVRLEGEDEVLVRSPAVAIASTRRVSIERREVGLAGSDPRRAALVRDALRVRAAALPGDPALAAAAAAERRESADRARARGLALGDLVGALAGDDPEAADRAFQDLVLLLSVDPDAVEEAARILADAPSGLEDALLDALGSAGTPRAQEALADALADPRRSPASRYRALVGFQAVERPTAASVEAVIAAGRSGPEFQDAALVVLGSLAGRLAAGEPRDRALAAIERLGRDAPLERLDALGNAGLPEVEERIASRLGDPDDEVRARAVYALRALGSASAAGHVRRALETDRSPDVRRTAIAVLDARNDPDEFPSIARALAEDPAAGVRLDAVHALARRLATDSRVGPWLEGSADDPDPDVRDAATRSLER